MTKKKKITVAGVIAVTILTGITAWVLWKLSPAEQEKSRLRDVSQKMGEMWNKTVDMQNRSKFTISGKIKLCGV